MTKKSELGVTAAETKNQVEQYLRVFRVFENADRVLAYMEGLEQNERELKARIDKANSEAERLERENADAKAANDKRLAAAAAKADAAEKRADEVGRAEVAEAREQAKAMVADAQQKVTALQKEERDLRAGNAMLEKAAQAKQTELATLEERIDEARATLRKMADV